jgi:ABC-type iron transport system FetAB permease component
MDIIEYTNLGLAFLVLVFSVISVRVFSQLKRKKTLIYLYLVSELLIAGFVVTVTFDHDIDTNFFYLVIYTNLTLFNCQYNKRNRHKIPLIFLSIQIVL